MLLQISKVTKPLLQVCSHVSFQVCLLYAFGCTEITPVGVCFSSSGEMMTMNPTAKHNLKALVSIVNVQKLLNNISTMNISYMQIIMCCRPVKNWDLRISRIFLVKLSYVGLQIGLTLHINGP